LVPAIRAVLGEEVAVLTPASAALRAQLTRRSALTSALHTLDEAFASGKKGPILKAVRAAIQECERDSPAQIDALKQRVSVRCAMAGLDVSKVIVAMGGPSRHDATFHQLLAR